QIFDLQIKAMDEADKFLKVVLNLKDKEIDRLDSEVNEEGKDAFIITGAPIEQLTFEEITYLDEIHQLIDVLVVNNIPQLYIC
ncbi:homoserine O-acetyltransferase/O-succinyltransferase family protein, partial [Limosilactobacillus reuteri]|uniref:homoserine O-acetyltransferase/O-succinyltransferase family protein n=1 Tax=Limosilactobacillus reuteri TaxID=1598 RepID=UPI003B001580